MERKWHLIVATCFGLPVATGLAFAKASDGGLKQYAVLLPVSLLLGLGCATLLQMLRSFGYIAVFAWMVAAGLFGVLAASLIWRLVP